jgi:hypothetical protein
VSTSGDDAPSGQNPREFRLRRAPRYRAFGYTGAVLGMLIGLVLAQLPAEAEPAGARGGSATWYLVGGLGLLGILLGLGFALIVERLHR